MCLSPFFMKPAAKAKLLLRNKQDQAMSALNESVKLTNEAAEKLRAHKKKHVLPPYHSNSISRFRYWFLSIYLNI